MKFLLSTCCIFLACLTARGLYQFPFGSNLYDESSTTPGEPAIPSAELFNSSEYRTSENGSAAQDPALPTLDSSLESISTDGQYSSSPEAPIITSTGNESQPQNSSQLIPPDDGNTNISETSNVTVSPPSDGSVADEQEGVVWWKPSTTVSSVTTSQPQSLYQKTWALISDTYTLSILVPVAAGVVFATTIILTIACCRCLRRCCVRRRLRKKVLPESVKNLRPSDRARLLAESSDDEF